jgi:tetratricopeptide (TPR) repeat protein
LSLYLLFRYEDTGNRYLLVLSALLLGLSSLARPNILVLVPGVLIWLWRFCRGCRRHWKPDSLIYVGCLLLMLTPLALRNYATTGELVLFGNYGGYNFLIGNNAQSDGKTVFLPAASPEIEQGYRDAVAIANRLAGRTLDNSELGGFWFRLGLEFIKRQPGDWLELELKKVVYLFSGYEIPNNRHIYFFAQRSPVLKYLLWDYGISFPFGLILPFSLLAVFAGRVRRDQFLFSFFIVSYSLSIIAFFVTARFRLPLTPILIIWAAAGFWYLVTLYGKGDFRRFYRYLIVLVVLVLLCNGLNHLSTFALRPPNRYEGHLTLGDAYHAEERYEEAERELRQAIRLNPRSVRVYNSLGNALAAQGKDSLAAEIYQRGIDVDPNYETIKKSLARLYRTRRQFGKLSTLVTTELNQNPNSPWALQEYAYLHDLLGEKDDAVDLYEKAFQADSTDYGAIFKKAQMYLELDRLEDAEREYKRLLQYSPNSIEVHANLGQVYARQNRLDEALEEFRLVTTRDPDNPSGYFNLVTLFQQRGEMDSARVYFQRLERLSPDFPRLDELGRQLEQTDFR